MKKTVSELIYEYLKKNRGFRFGGTLEREVTQLHKPSYVARTLRHLAEENKIYKDYRLVDGHQVVLYKFKKV